MSYYTEILNLDEQDLFELSDANYGYASALTKQENPANNLIIASSYLIAGIYKTIISPGTGSKAFNLSANFYLKDQNSFWIIPSICSNNLDLINNNKESIEAINKYSYLEQFLFRVYTQKNWNYNSLYSIQDLYVGNLKIPFGLYFNSFKHDTKEEKLESIYAVLNRTSAHTKFLMTDSFHWQNATGTIIPIEPEILAYCLTLLKINNAFRISLVDELSKLDSIAKIPLIIAQELIFKSGEQQSYHQ